MALTDKQERFVDEYLVDLNATQAYIRSGYSVKKKVTAEQNASKLLKNTKVQTCIAEKQKERRKRTEITQDMVLRELAKIGFANVTDFVEIDGHGAMCMVKVKPTADMEEDKIGAIAGIKEGTNGVEIKLNDKGKALELIGRHLGMFTDKIEVNGALGVQIVDDIHDE